MTTLRRWSILVYLVCVLSARALAQTTKPTATPRYESGRANSPVVPIALPAPGQASTAASERQAKQVHLLIAVDTANPDIGKGGECDQRNVKNLFQELLREVGQVHVKTISGASLTQNHPPVARDAPVNRCVHALVG